MEKYKSRYQGAERGIFEHNKNILRNTCTTCALCGYPLDRSLKYPHPLSISIDHIIPMAHGGKSTLDNLQATHLICNKEKGKKILDLKNKRGNSTHTYKASVTEKNNKIPQYLDWSQRK